MDNKQLENIMAQLFFELGHKIDLYHFENIREIVIVKHGELLKIENVIKTFKY